MLILSIIWILLSIVCFFAENTTMGIIWLCAGTAELIIMLIKRIKDNNKIFKEKDMKKAFVCSIICHGGILGGGIYIDDNSVTYKTNKLTVDKKYKHLVLPLDEIDNLSWKWIVFPIATIRMRNGEEYKFIIFNKKQFDKRYKEAGQL